MKKHIGSFLLMLILLITMAGCGSMEKEMTEGEKDKEDKIQIGLCFDSFVIERWQRDRDIFVSMSRMPMGILNSRENRSITLLIREWM